MKFATIAATLFAVSTTQFLAAGDHNKTQYGSISLDGTVTRQEKEVLDRTGEIKTVAVYYLQTPNSRTVLPVPTHCNGELKLDFASFVGRNVTVAARGLKKPATDGQTLAYVHEVARVELRHDYESISLNGRILYRKTQELDATGEIRTTESYRLATRNAEITLPARIEGVDLQRFVGQDVSLAGRGIQKANTQGRILTYLHEVVSVREMESPVTDGSLFSNATN